MLSHLLAPSHLSLARFFFLSHLLSHPCCHFLIVTSAIHQLHRAVDVEALESLRLTRVMIFKKPSLKQPFCL